MGAIKTALVLGGGAARGAYEAGVISFLRDELEPGLGRELPLDILSGASVGAINSSFLAASAHEPALQGRKLVEVWRLLNCEDVLAFGVGDLLRLGRGLLPPPVRAGPKRRRGGLIDPRGLEEIVLRRISWRSIHQNLAKGHLDALAVGATHVGSGHVVYFIDKPRGPAPDFSREPMLRSMMTRVGPRHALASAAIPFLFPAVPVNGQLYVDGGLRLSVPLVPAIRMGAQRVLVVSLLPPLEQEPTLTEIREQERAIQRLTSAASFLLGKTLNALLVDRAEEDLDRMKRINSVLVAGNKAFGPKFNAMLNRSLRAPVRYVRNLAVRPSRDISKVAGEYARSPEFRKRAKGLAGKAIRMLADQEATHQADLVSYLLFDGGFAEVLIEMGRSDARALGDEWVRFWSEEPETAIEEAQQAAGLS